MLNIIKSLMMITVVAAVAIGSTKAVWSDSGQSTGNTFQAGTLDLKLSDDDQTDLDTVTVTWAGNGMLPGGAGVAATLNLKNVGSPAADHVHFSLANNITEDESLAGAGDSDPITNYLQVTSLTYDGTDILNFNLIPDDNGNGYIDLADMEAAGQIGASTGLLTDDPPKLALDDLNNDHSLVMTVALNSDSPDENQGDLNTMAVTATLHQTDGQ
jgi:predicted ribosomally synthesized peptide with SipW-like signal peptide